MPHALPRPATPAPRFLVPLPGLLAVLAPLVFNATTSAGEGGQGEDVPKFSVTPLAVVGRPGEPTVRAINARGGVAGAIATFPPGGNVATRIDAYFATPGGQPQVLGQLPGGFDRTIASDLNDNDWVVGFSNAGAAGQPQSQGRDHAIVWSRQNGLTDLGVLPGGATSWANAINNRNQVVGYSDSDRGRRAFLWEPGGGGLVDLGDFGGDRGGVTAWDISDRGHAVGSAYVNGTGSHAFVWTPHNGLIDIGDLPGGIEEAAAFAVNEHDHAVGYSLTDDGHRAFFWSEEAGMVNLGALPDSTEGSIARDISNGDWVVGSSRRPGPTSAGRAFLWTPSTGLHDLNALLDETGAGWSVHDAWQVTDRGEILAIGLRGADYHAVLLQPQVPEPATAMAAAALLAAGTRAARRRRR